MTDSLPRISFRQVLALNACWVGLSFMWNSLHIIILPAVLLHLVPYSQKNTYLGLLTFGGLVIAMLVQPLSGAWSDAWKSRWGRRRPLILIGTLVDYVFLAFLAWSGGFGWILAGYLGLQISSNLAHGPAQGLLPDRVPANQLGWASGFKNLMDMFGLVAATLLMGRLLNPQERHPVLSVGLVAAVLLVGTFVTILGVREAPSDIGANLKKGSAKWVPVLSDLKIDLDAHREFVWLIGSRLLFLLGIYAIQAFAQYFIRDKLGVTNPVKLTGDLLATITLALIVFAVSGGWLGDRFGHKRIHITACAIGALGCLALLWARTPQMVLSFGILLGVGIGLFLTSNWAMANRLAPQAEAGRFLGLTNLATAGAGALGRLEGPVIDLLNNAKPGAWWGYSTMFLFGAICILGSAAVLVRIPEQSRSSQPSAIKSPG